jgi:hypothetical protein
MASYRRRKVGVIFRGALGLLMVTFSATFWFLKGIKCAQRFAQARTGCLLHGRELAARLALSAIHLKAL